VNRRRIAAGAAAAGLCVWGWAGASAVAFEDVAGQAGIAFVLRNGAAGEWRQIETMVAGAVAADFDGDGRPDLFFVNGATRPGEGNRLYRNRGDGTFADGTAAAGLEGAGFGMGGAAADFDNDGDQDVFVAGVGRNFLYRNRGDGTFADVTGPAGLGEGTGWAVSAGWFDYDVDGHLDLFVVQYVDWRPGADPPCKTGGVRTYCHPRHYAGLPNRLFRNQGDGTFREVTAESGIGAAVGKGMGLAILDFNGDGRLDVFVTNDTVPNFLFRNDGAGRFREVGMAAGVGLNEDGRALSSMGVDARDVNNDGREDLWLTANANETFPLFVNLGRGLFGDETYPSTIGRATMAWTGWSNGIFDFNNDGRKDLFGACGSIDANTEAFSHRRSKQGNRVLVNEGGGVFRDGVVAGGEAMHRGAAFADFDGDGRVDVAVTRIGERAGLLRNTSAGTGHWLGVRLRGRQANRDGLGAMVRVKGVAGGEQWNRVTTAVGYGSSSDRVAHFGLGGAARVAELEVVWPGGKRQVLRDVAGDRVVEVEER
jgi:hypothetical protein